MSISLKTNNNYQSQARFGEYSEKDYDEFVMPKPRKSRSYLVGWIVSVVLMLMLLCTFILPRNTKQHTTQPTQPNLHQELPFSTSAGTPKFTSNFIFGDSFSDTEFDIYAEQPNDIHLLGNRHNIKPIWVDYLVSKTPFHTLNFARGGSVVDSKLVKNTFGTSLHHQITNDFLPLYTNSTNSSRPAPPWDPSTTLFTFWFGINDVVLSADASIHAPLDSIMTSYRASLETLYSAGARNFLFLNVPPIHHVYNTKYDITDMKTDIYRFNKRLLSLRSDFMRDHAADITSALYLDIHELWTQAITAPISFEETKDIMNTKSYCLAYLLDQTPGDGGNVFDNGCEWPLNQYFWQNLHVTSKVHELTASVMWADCLEEGLPRRYCS